MKRRIVCWGLVILWMSVIFMFSSQDAKISTGTSGRVIRAVVSAVYPDFNNLSEEQQEKIVSSLQAFVRKVAHATEFFILGLLMFFAINEKRRKDYWLSELLCVLYAATDEFHQIFVDGRSCRIFDIFVDAAGSALALLLIFGIKKALKKQ